MIARIPLENQIFFSVEFLDNIKMDHRCTISAINILTHIHLQQPIRNQNEPSARKESDIMSVGNVSIDSPKRINFIKSGIQKYPRISFDIKICILTVALRFKIH